MRINAYIAVAREMLGCGDRAVFFDAAHVFSDVTRDFLRILTERTDINNGILRVAVYVRIGSENPLHAGGASFERERLARLISQLRFARGGNRHRRGERRAFLEAHPRAIFKVGADEQRNLRCALQIVKQRYGRIDLAAAQAERSASR